jgi:hypothetical protein
MSDDTPTQRYPEGFPPPGGPGGGTGDGTTPPTAPTTPNEPQPAASDDLPTERFSAAGTVPPAATVPPAGTPPYAAAPPTVPPAAGPPTTTPPPKNNKGLIITLSIIGGVLLLLVIGLLIWIGVSGSPDPEPTPTDTPSATPTPTETPTPTPTPTETTAPPPANVITSFTASTETADCTAAVGGSVPVTFSWATTGVQLWFGVGTDDAKAEPFDTFPLNDTIDFDYQCGQPDLQQRYTITVERTDGSTQSQTIVIREV